MSVLFLTLALAQTPGTSLDAEIRALQDAAEGDDLAWRLVESLTTEVGARLAGTDAEARARAWAVETLGSLGFEQVRVEETPVPGWRRGVEIARVVAPHPQDLAVTALGGSIATPREGIVAEVLRLETLAELEALPKEALRGKIAFIDQAMPRTQDGSGYGAVVAMRGSGASIAAARGARALLIRSVGTDHHRFPHTGMLRYEDGGAKIPAAALSGPDADQLARLLARGRPVRVSLQLGPTETGPQTTGNVIGEIRGATHPEEIVLVGAHLDSWDLGTGAVDDGAGVAIVTAAAHLIRARAPRRPARTVRVVLFGAEEVGLVGAKAYAVTHAAELDRHLVALESDFGAGPIYRLSTAGAESAGPLVEAFRARHLSRLRIIRGEEGRAGGPDLIPMKGAGVPLLGLDQDGRDYFDLHHTADDTVDKIDPRSLRQNVAAYATVLWWVTETGPRLRSSTRDEPSRARGSAAP